MTCVLISRPWPSPGTPLFLSGSGQKKLPESRPGPGKTDEAQPAVLGRLASRMHRNGENDSWSVPSLQKSNQRERARNCVAYRTTDVAMPGKGQRGEPATKW